MPILPSGGGNLHFRPTAGNNFGGRKAMTSINNPAGKALASINDREKSVTNAAHLGDIAHVYTTGDSTNMYGSRQEFGKNSSVSASQMTQKKSDAAQLDSGSARAPSRPILPPL